MVAGVHDHTSWLLILSQPMDEVKTKIWAVPLGDQIIRGRGGKTNKYQVVLPGEEAASNIWWTFLQEMPGYTVRSSKSSTSVFEGRKTLSSDHWKSWVKDLLRHCTYKLLEIILQVIPRLGMYKISHTQPRSSFKLDTRAIQKLLDRHTSPLTVPVTKMWTTVKRIQKAFLRHHWCSYYNSASQEQIFS